MIHHIKGRNVHQILPIALDYMLKHGQGSSSRNGTVLSLEGLTVIEYERPYERVMFWPERNANPFFHLMESLWMLSGRNDLGFLSQFVKTMANFSDDGQTFNAAYGHRWRKHFGKDQLLTVYKALAKDPSCRRQVIGIWDPSHDLGLQSKDLPCNLAVVPRIVDDSLDITVYNRSNDLVWGALGANAVHFSILQEWLAGALGVPVGRYYQVSTNMHLYTKTHAELMERMANPMPQTGPYEDPDMIVFPLFGGTVPAEEWLAELELFLDNPDVIGLREPFFRKVARPMMKAWGHYKNNQSSMALFATKDIRDNAWSRACSEWIERRIAARQVAQDSGVSYE